MDLDSALAGKPAEGATALDILHADHLEIERLFGEYHSAEHDSQLRRVTLQTLCMQLELHDKLEASSLYPALRKMRPQIVGDAERDHDDIRHRVRELRERNDCSAECDNKLTQLQALVEHHVRDEEDGLFRYLQQQSDQWLRALGTALVRCKEELTRSTAEFEGPAT